MFMINANADDVVTRVIFCAQGGINQALVSRNALRISIVNVAGNPTRCITLLGLQRPQCNRMTGIYIV